MAYILYVYTFSRKMPYTTTSHPPIRLSSTRVVITDQFLPILHLSLLDLTWNDSLNPDEDVSTLQVGAVGQNLQLMANALDLGCVPCGDFPPYQTLKHIGLPEHETGRIIMPLGHPLYPYNFHYFPFWISLLPKIQKSSISLSDALKTRNETDTFTGELPRTMQIQMLWSVYGYSYFVDNSEFSFSYHISRHRTVPSAHGYYPLQVYGVTATGAYQVHP